MDIVKLYDRLHQLKRDGLVTTWNVEVDERSDDVVTRVTFSLSPDDQLDPGVICITLYDGKDDQDVVISFPNGMKPTQQMQ